MASQNLVPRNSTHNISKITRALDPTALLFYAFLLLPLLYVHGAPITSRAIRFAVLLGVLLLSLTLLSVRNKFIMNVKNLPWAAKIALAVMLAGSVISTLLSSDSLEIRLLGLVPEYLGLLIWVSFIVVGIAFLDRAKELLTSKITLAIFLVITLASLYISMSELRLGLRLQGLLFQATTMGMFSVLAFIVGLYGLDTAKDARHKALATILLLASFSAVILSQSRISYIAMSLLCCAVVFLAWYKNRTLVVVSLVAVATILCLPWMFPDYFERFHAASIKSGTEYRLDLYAISGNDLLKNNTLVGNGPSSLPPSINNTNVVPEAIKKSLKTGDVFLSTHNLFFDFAYYFGVISCLALGVISGLALFYGMRAKEFFLVGLFFVLLANALTNVPSLELTSLYFILLFALLYTAQGRVNEK